MDTFGSFPIISYQRDNILNFLFAFFHTEPFC